MGENWIPEWRVIPVGGIPFDGYRLYRATKAAGAPGCIAWKIDRDGEYERRHLAWGGVDYGYWPVPTVPGHICVFNPNSVEHAVHQASGLGWLNEDVASCTYRPSAESDLVIGLRIWHEVLHCMLGSGAPDEMTTTPGFVAFLEQRFGEDDPWVVQFRLNPFAYGHATDYQKEFYAYLTATHFPNEAAKPAHRTPLRYLVCDLLDAILARIRHTPVQKT